MRLLLPLLLLVACAGHDAGAVQPAAHGTFEIKPVYSNITFAITKWRVMREEGTFRDFRGTLRYDPVHPEQASVEVVVRSESIDTKVGPRDRALRSADFLDAKHFPTLTFRSTSVKPIDAHTADVRGDLTIRGVTRPITFRATLTGVQAVPELGEVAGFETRFTINRRDFGVLGTAFGAIPSILSDEVEVRIALGATSGQ